MSKSTYYIPIIWFLLFFVVSNDLSLLENVFECFSYWRGIVPTDCARRNPLKKWKCYFGEHVYKTDSASPKHGKISLNPPPLYICSKKIRGGIASWWEQQDRARDHNNSLPKVMEPLYLKLFPHGPHSF